jgi:cation diffusion facilitator family transporter
MNEAGGFKSSQPTPHARLAELAERGKSRVAFGILISAVLAAVKMISGIVGNSHALIADGVESMMDIVSSLAVVGSLRMSAQPPNERYPYGYGKIEPLASMVVAVALFVAAFGIAIQSVREIVTPQHAPAWFTLVVLIGVVAAKEGMFRFLNQTGVDVGSTAVQADAWHHRSDALTSLAAFVGISIALVGGDGYEAADDWAALLACAMIVFNGMRLLRTGLRDVLDAAVAPELEHSIREAGLGVEGVQAIEKCRVRKSGLMHFVDIHVVVDGEVSVSRGHEIAHEVKDALLTKDLKILDVAVHIEPTGLELTDPGRSQ